jgi:quercetin dioxygenase-like cupin family protein
MAVAEIADRLEIHANTARFHLESLVSDGRVERTTADSGSPGRPPQLFHAVQGMDPMGPRHFRVLAEVLAASLATDADPSGRVLEAGRFWGRHQASTVTDATETDEALEPAESVERLMRLLDELGFARAGRRWRPAADRPSALPVSRAGGQSVRRGVPGPLGPDAGRDAVVGLAHHGRPTQALCRTRPVRGSPQRCRRIVMDVVSLTALADAQLAAARASSAGRSAHTIHGRQTSALRQTVLALVAGRALGEHESPGEATLQVLTGRVRLSAGDDSWEAATGDYLVIPPARHDLAAIDDSAVLLSVVTDARG